MRHFSMTFKQLGQALLDDGRHRRIHFFKITKNVAIVWDRKYGK